MLYSASSLAVEEHDTIKKLIGSLYKLHEEYGPKLQACGGSALDDSWEIDSGQM
jgi:hypothetical protein